MGEGGVAVLAVLDVAFFEGFEEGRHGGLEGEAWQVVLDVARDGAF